MDGWEAAVWVDGGVGWGFDFGEGEGDYFVGEVEFFHEDGGLGRVGTAFSPDFEGF